MLFLALKSNSLKFKTIYLMRDASFMVASYLGEIKLMLESNLKEKLIGFAFGCGVLARDPRTWSVQIHRSKKYRFSDPD